MVGEKQVVAGPAAGWTWRLVARALASVGFLVLHVAGGAYALLMLRGLWLIRLSLKIVAEHLRLLQFLHLSWFALPLGAALVAALAAVEVGRILWRWQRHQPEPDLGLRVRVLVYVALACVFVNAFLFSTPATFKGPFRVQLVFFPQLSAVFAYGAYAFWSVTLPRWRRVFPDRVRHGLDVLAMNIALLLVLAEFSLRVLAAFWPSPLLVTASSSSRVRRDAGRQPPGTLLFGVPLNSGGHFDAEFVPRAASSKRIVVWIGDSFSYGIVPLEYHFTKVAERRLRGVAFYNMGFPGLGPSDYLALLEEEALALDPHLVVVELFVGNDIGDDYRPPGAASWYDGDSYLLAIVWHRLRIMRQAKLVDVGQSTKAAARLIQEQLAALLPWLTDPLLERPSLSRDVFLQVEDMRAAGVCLPHEGLYPPLFGTFKEMERAAGDVPLAFMVIPDEFQIEDDLWKELVRRSGQPLDRDLAQRTVVPWLRARGLPVLDLLPLMRAVPPLKDGRRHLYHLQDTHFNARGNEVAGRALARFADSVLSVAARHEGRAPPPKPVPLPLHVVFGDSVTRHWMKEGWSDLDDGVAGGRPLVWSDGLQSILSVPLPHSGDIRMDFEALPFAFPGSPEQRVSIVLNGRLIDEVRLRPGVNRYSVNLPQTALRTSTDALEFRYAYARVPQEVLSNSADRRMLAVAWYSLDFSTQSP